MIEEFRDIPGYEGYYQISNLGEVKSFYRNRERILKHSKDKDGYRIIGLTNNNNNNKVKTERIHRLVLKTFKPDEEFKDAQVNHKNGIRYDNRLDNLEWCNHSENTIHSFRVLGRKSADISREKNPKSKLNENKISIIRQAYNKGYLNQPELANIFGVTQATISGIVLNKSWIN